MRFWLPAYGLLIAAFLLLAHEWARLPDGKFHVAALDVGQGDGLLLQTPSGQRIIVDGGPDLSLLERLGEELPFFTRTIDLLVLTHTDADHVTAFPEVLRRYDVRNVLLTGVAREDSAVYSAFLTALAESKARVILADAGNDIDLGGGTLFDVLWPARRSSADIGVLTATCMSQEERAQSEGGPMGALFGCEVSESNNAGIVAKITSGDHTVLLTADIEEKVEEALLKAGTDLRADILKVPHHGSETSSSTGFLLAVAPDLAVISVGEGNPYGHPRPKILQRYAALGIPVRRTDEEGKVEVIFP